MDLLILGASVRSAAFSAIRAGFRPVCVDLFADLDLTRVCSTTGRVEPGDYPEGLADAALALRPMPWIYTGGLENHPDLVDRISTHHRLLGNPGSVLRGVRDPLAVAEAVRSVGLAAPEVRLDPVDLPTDGSWLKKPLASAGGRGIEPWRGGTVPPGRFYFQQRVEGLSYSALCLGNLGRYGVTKCLGVTRQYVGRPGNRFAYRGTLAPCQVLPEFRDWVQSIGWRIGRTLAVEFGLRGLFGVDLILGETSVWVIEVNPRYTASVEALEWATGESVLMAHAQDFGIARPGSPIAIRPQEFVSKSILYATRPCIWNEITFPESPLDQMPEIADVPHPGTRFNPGEPVLTILASGDSPTDCRRRLAERLRWWRRRLDIGPRLKPGC